MYNSLQMITSPSTTNNKGYLKKLKKKVREGKINNESMFLKCQELNIEVTPSIEFSGKFSTIFFYQNNYNTFTLYCDILY